MEPHYRHTQIGWVMLAVVAFAAALFAAQTGLRRPGSWIPFAILGLMLLLFGTLRVEVGRDAIRGAFGVGLIRRTVSTRDVAAWQPVRTPWYVGWGIRLIRGGVLWNVSGFDGVELVLRTGRRFRIGTDEPEALSRALETVLGPPAAAGAALPEPRGGVRGIAWLLAVLALVGVAIAALFHFQSKPPQVRLTPSGFAVDSLFYGQEYPASEVVSVSLEPALPRVLARTNGFAGAGALRGHFRVEGLGDGKLFVDRGYPPFVLVRLKRGFVAVNFEEPGRAQAVYEELARAFPDRATPPQP